MAGSRLAPVGIALGVLVLAAVFVVVTTDERAPVRVASSAAAAFDDNSVVATAGRALFSPDGTRVAVIGDGGIGVARRGRVTALTKAGSRAADVAWMPNSRSLLVAEGPVATGRLVMIDLAGAAIGSAVLDHPFSVGEGHGLTVDASGVVAVAVRETRDVIGGRRRHDLVRVDLTTGAVTAITQTADADERWPQFVGDDSVVFTRAVDGVERVFLRELASGTERALSPESTHARPVGVIGDDVPVYVATTEEQVEVVAVVPDGRRLLGEFPAGTTVWTVDPSGGNAIVSAPGTDRNGNPTRVTRLVTLTAL